MSLTHKWNKLVLWTITSPPSEMMRSSKCFLHVSKIPTLTYNRENNVHIKYQLSHIIGRITFI